MWAIYYEGTPVIKGENLVDLNKLCNDLNTKLNTTYYIGEWANG